MVTSGVGRVIGRRSTSKDREYTAIWIYIPSKVGSDSTFPFRIGEPCMINISTKNKLLVVKPISKEKARELGWKERRKSEIIVSRPR